MANSDSIRRIRARSEPVELLNDTFNVETIDSSTPVKPRRQRANTFDLRSVMEEYGSTADK